MCDDDQNAALVPLGEGLEGKGVGLIFSFLLVVFKAYDYCMLYISLGKSLEEKEWD